MFLPDAKALLESLRHDWTAITPDFKKIVSENSIDIQA